MQVLITAGGTVAPIDDVRVITNRSTGRFASSLAEACLKHHTQVTYLATTPLTAGPLEIPRQRLDGNVDIQSLRSLMLNRLAHAYNHAGQLRRIDVKTGTVADYADTLKHELLAQKWDLVMLAAAVSDYEPEPTSGKIRSDADELTIHLKRTPKVIQQVRGWVGRETNIVGFKLTSGATDQQMIDTAQQACATNDANWTIVNDQSSVSQGQHRVALVSRQGVDRWFEPGEDLGQRVVDRLLRLIRNEG